MTDRDAENRLALEDRRQNEIDHDQRAAGENARDLHYRPKARTMKRV